MVYNLVSSGNVKGKVRIPTLFSQATEPLGGLRKTNAMCHGKGAQNIHSNPANESPSYCKTIPMTNNRRKET